MNALSQGQDFLQQFLSKQPVEVAEYHIDDIILTLHDTGILEVTPRVGAAMDVVISAGIHGNETAPIELVNQLVMGILSEEVAVGNRLLFVLGNADAMNQGTRFVVHNMNRLFAGAHSDKTLASCYELNRARRLEAAVDLFFEQSVSPYRLHLDLHTAIRGSHRERFAIYPYSEKRQIDQTGLEILSACQVNTLLLMEHEGHTFSSHSGLKWGAQSFTVELGRVAPFGGNVLSRYADVSDTLEAIVTGEPVKGQAAAVEQFRVAEEIRHTGEGFALNLPDNGLNFTQFAPGDWVWSDHDRRHQVALRPQYLVFPNTQVPKGQRAGLLVEPITP